MVSAVSRRRRQRDCQHTRGRNINDLRVIKTTRPHRTGGETPGKTCLLVAALLDGGIVVYTQTALNLGTGKSNTNADSVLDKPWLICYILRTMTEQENKILDLTRAFFEMCRKHDKYALYSQAYIDWYREMERYDKPCDPPIQTC